jgi:hypothetical protein
MIVAISACAVMLGLILHALLVRLPRNLLLLDALQMATGPLDESFLVEETEAMKAWKATDGNYLSITHRGICLGRRTEGERWSYADVEKCMSHLAS